MSAAANTLFESELTELGWNDLKKLAKECGVAVKGTREDITAEILTNSNTTTVAKSAKKQPMAASISFNLINSPKLTVP
jgi:ribosomal protein L12E/L44/L45/RPP1/RPP2